MSVKTNSLMALRRKISYHVPKMTAWEILIGGSRLITPHVLSKEVWGNRSELQECTRRKRQVGGSDSKWSYQDNVNYFASEVDHLGL